MNQLSPKLASELAANVYSLIDAEDADIFGNTYIEKYFAINSKGIGKTGGFIFNRQSGFAVMGLGKGQYLGDAIIAIRGTQLIADWGTNAQLGLSVGDGNQIVHAGFNNAFVSLRQQIATFLDKWRISNPGKAIHFVGHSLGGALASLAADWASVNNYASNINLYTFGSPRVGQQGFASANTHRLNQIFRCTHGADVVPKVPLWPFIHAPYQGVEYRLDNSQGLRISAHGMDPKAGAEPGYLVSANTEHWGHLHVKASEYLQPVKLRYENRNQASYSDQWSDKLSAALITVLKEAGYYGAIVAQATASYGLTFYDLVAKTLEKIAAAASSFADDVRGLLGHMLAFAGAVVTTVVDLTYATIRAIFNKMLARLYSSVKEAIKSVHK
ncbi:lipase family protein [Shewanella frigidimarina]|uniref:Lipase, class 3 n=1 Tax=Shewanella frigidimarina (strain NCIMB 400) TaxID=318167 RepID=Q086U2_SHEFN|nr:lipase family protein [Shewanella frigidimarina]ABI70723.1 lipase, class 3 [Shewanella frigidimarina NCIMB 400]